MYSIRPMNIAALDLNLLVAFEALLIERSVSRAADRIGLSQPGMSNALARLRNVFNDRLFSRNRQMLVPTGRAVALAGPVRDALNLIRNAISDQREFDPSRAETRFRILASDYCEMVVLAPLVCRVRRIAPGVQIQTLRPTALFPLPTDELASDRVDLAVGLFPDLLPPGSGLVQATLTEDRLVGLVGRGFRHSYLTLRQFLQASQVRVSIGGDIPGLMDEILAKRGYKRNVHLTCGGFLSVPWFLGETGLLAIVPEKLAVAVAPLLKLRICRLPLKLPHLRISAVWHERNASHPAHQWMRSQLMATVQSKEESARCSQEAPETQRNCSSTRRKGRVFRISV